MTICFFLANNHGTYTFRDAEIVMDNETVLVVQYTAMSDGKPKKVTMQKRLIAGWAVS